ncbi:MAG: hypothetical protein KBG02_16015 [Haliscomenobacter sp.]|nr:hypothetical protein [Haliscomenobacter sp.]MBP9078376.1 hypothetical protein [Haliscomenobacter sp.]MBP9874150.1 hypothetical protein [Haliscomenobacter sp.]
MKDLRQEFLDQLEHKYGKWDKTTSNFGSTPFGLIANDLSISASQFTKLLSGTATEGMYTRSIDNVKRLIRLENALKELEESRSVKEKNATLLLKQDRRLRQSAKRSIILALVALIAGSAGMYLIQSGRLAKEPNETRSSLNPLTAFFDREFNADFQSPYLKESDVQEYCPCSAFEGVWSLEEEYKLPLPGNKKPGIYYLAKSADVRMKCSKSDTLPAGKGNVLLVFEYLINEIWVDKRKIPLFPTYFDKETKQFTQAFNDLVFENDPNFQKVATIHSFFISKIELYKDSIVRKGEPCGRYATGVNEALVSEYAIDLKHILENVLGDLTQTSCHSIANYFCDPNLLQEGKSVLSFDCLYTIKSENLGFGGGYPYRKGYRLQKQNYSDNLTCNCDSYPGD